MCAMFLVRVMVWWGFFICGWVASRKLSNWDIVVSIYNSTCSSLSRMSTICGVEEYVLAYECQLQMKMVLFTISGIVHISGACNA